MWYNKVTQELSTGNPWGHDGYFNPEKIQELYPEWEQVANDFMPPAAVPTAEQRIAALDAEYQPQFQELQLAWAAASMDGNTELAASIQQDYASLKTEYQQKREEIINGN